MRITGGKARGIPLKSGKQGIVRPATDRLREAVFSSLGTGTVDARFFDLFAGSGAYGLEAWSRGAAGGIFVEKNRVVAATIVQNSRAVARSLGQSPDHVKVITGDVTRWAPAMGDRADLIFVDPPYDLIEDVAPELFFKFETWLAREGTVVFEMPGGTELEFDGWECYKRLGKGRHQPGCCFFRRAGSE